MKKRLLATSLRAGILLFWLGTMMWLARYEAFPERFTHALSGYRSLISNDKLISDSWMRILIKGRPVGFSQSSIDVDESSTTRHYKMSNRIHMKLSLMGFTQVIRVSADVDLDLFCRLMEFSFTLVSEAYTFEVQAERLGDGNTFDVSMKTPGTKSSSKVVIPDDVVIYSPQTEMTVKSLKPGKSLTLRTLDPATMKTMNVLIKALRKETIEVQGQSYEATVIATELFGRESLSWIDSEGSILRQETPLGWIMEKCDPALAFDAFRHADTSTDLLADMAVPCHGTIKNPKTCKSLTLRMTGVAFSEEELTTERQTVLGITNTTCTLRLVPSQEPDGGQDNIAHESLTNHLAATRFLQSDNEDIRSRAKKIIGKRSDPWEQSLAILKWVDEKVRDELTVSLPSALEVLGTMRGDCNEHTYLFVALARAVGIPAKIVVGLAYHKGSFYYHAWPAVHIGRWIEMDPTWGQKNVDASHIALLEGELANQYQLLKVIGQLRIEVISEEP